MNFLSFPLLARELTERAARKRTYIGRVAYGVALYAIFLFVLRRLVGSVESDPTGFGVLGLGRNLFQKLVEFQCWGVLLFQPALMAGVLTYEKERDSFSLLLLTGMSPGKILLEKFLAGLLPMATLLLLALPPGAITMGYGGVSPQLLASGAMVLLATWLQVGAFSLLCSAWCRKTVTAMLCAYLGSVVIYIAPAAAYSLCVRYVLWGADLRGLDVPEWLWALWPPEAFSRVLAFQENAASLGETDAGVMWARLLGEAWHRCLPLLATAAVCLLLARLVMVRRAFAPMPRSRRTEREKSGRPRVVAVSRWLHALWPKHTDLPADDPVAWRESGRSVLGRHRPYQYLAAVTVTLILGIFLLRLYPATAAPDRLYHLVLVLGVAAIVIIVVRSVGALIGERTNQTLDILLTTPLGAAEILRQKARALRHYWVLFGLMLATVFAVKGWSEYQYVPIEHGWRSLGVYWLCDALVLIVYPPLIVWTSLLLALWLRAKARAIVVSLLVFAAWFLCAPAVLSFGAPYWGFAEKGSWLSDHGLWLSLLSPLGIVDANERGLLRFFHTLYGGHLRWTKGWGEPLVPIAVNFIAYGFLFLGIRMFCLHKADRWLRDASR